MRTAGLKIPESLRVVPASVHLKQPLRFMSRNHPVGDDLIAEGVSKPERLRTLEFPEITANSRERPSRNLSEVPNHFVTRYRFGCQYDGPASLGQRRDRL